VKIKKNFCLNPPKADEFKFFSEARYFHTPEEFSVGEFFGSFFAHSKNEHA